MNDVDKLREALYNAFLQAFEANPECKSGLSWLGRNHNK